MYFFDKNEAYKNRVFLIDESGAAHTYGQVWQIGDTITAKIPGRSLCLLLAGNDVSSVSSYMALLRKRCPVILMGKNADEAVIKRMKETYRPAFVIAAGASEDQKEEPAAMDRNLGLLLSTSGSTGAQKLVRLSYDNLQANCDSITEYLELTEEERPITTLPIEYTYGLSVIHSHAAVGASIILTDRTFFDPKFWELVEKYGATSLAGVPYSYEMLHRLRIERMDLPKLQTLTQAGGHLKTELQESIGTWAMESGRRLFVMYGQTEATARMSYIPPRRCLEKIGSIGIPVPGGRIELLGTDGEVITEPNINGELIFYGANVSLGYAVCREDLAKGDENGGRLETGDIAYRDEEGYFYISGRKKRFIKLYGKRISLDQIQDELQEDFDTADIVCTGDDEHGVFVWKTEQAAGAEQDALEQIFWDRWGIRDDKVHIRTIGQIPRNASGKTIYKDLIQGEEDGVPQQ